MKPEKPGKSTSCQSLTGCVADAQFQRRGSKYFTSRYNVWPNSRIPFIPTENIKASDLNIP